MIQYRIKSSKEINNYLHIIETRKDGYEVLIVNEHEDYRKEVKDFISRELFETCLRTGYLIKMNTERKLMSA